MVGGPVGKSVPTAPLVQGLALRPFLIKESKSPSNDLPTFNHAVMLFVSFLVQAAVFWGGAQLVGSPALGDSAWWMCYLAGAAYLVAGHWLPRIRLGLKASLEVIGYSGLLAVLFWGANWALDVLGNSVGTGRLPPEFRTGFPLHLMLVPGVASVGFAALVANAVQRMVGRKVEGTSRTLH